MQNNETDPSFKLNAVDKNYLDLQPLNFASNERNPQLVPVVFGSPSDKQENTKVTKTPDVPFRSHSNRSGNFSESYGQRPQSAVQFNQFNGSKSIPEYGRNVEQTDQNVNRGHYQGLQFQHSNLPQMLAHQTPFQVRHLIPVEPPTPAQAPMRPNLSVPSNTFNPYGMAFPIIKYGAPTTETQYPYAQFPTNPQNMLPQPFYMNLNLLNMPTPVVTHAPPNSAFIFTEPPTSRQSNTNLRPMYSQTPTAVNTLSALADTIGSKRRTSVDEEVSAFQNYKKLKLVPLTTPSTISNDGNEENSSSIVKDENSNVLGRSINYDFCCVLCQEARKDTVLLPCLHLCVCEKCSGNISLCPICRRACDELLTVIT